MKNTISRLALANSANPAQTQCQQGFVACESLRISANPDTTLRSFSLFGAENLLLTPRRPVLVSLLNGRQFFREILMTQPVNPNLHPIWNDILGIKSVQVPAASADSNAAANYLMAQVSAPMATTVAAPMAATIATPTTHVNQDWQINSANPVAGRPVGIKRQVGPNLFISATVHPGDPRYPRFSTQHNPSPINL